MYNVSSFLPPNFPNWVSLYNKIKKSGLQNEDVVSVVSGHDILWYKPEFIRARCFEELESDDFTADDLDFLRYVLSKSMYGIDKGELINKISNRLNIAASLGKFD